MMSRLHSLCSPSRLEKFAKESRREDVKFQVDIDTFGKRQRRDRKPETIQTSHIFRFSILQFQLLRHFITDE